MYNSDALNKVVAGYTKNKAVAIRLLGKSRDVVQALIVSAIESKLLDENNECNYAFCTDAVRSLGATRCVDIGAVKNYILWVFNSEPVPSSTDKIMFDENKSSASWNNKEAKFETRRVKVPLDSFINDSGEEQTRCKKVAYPLDVALARAKYSRVEWWQFVADKPKAAYKGKLLAAIRSDLRKAQEGEYIPDTQEARLLKAITTLCVEYGYAEKIGG